MKRSPFFLLIIVAFMNVSTIAIAEMVALFPTFDRSASDVAIPGTLLDGVFDEFFNNEDDSNIRAHRSIGGAFEIRGAFEFSLEYVPAQSSIESALLFLQTSIRGLPPGDFGEIRFDGYAGNGVAELADFSADFLQVTLPGRPPVGQPLLTIDVSDLVRSLHDVDASHAGFTMRASPGISYGVASSEFGFEPFTPRLEITYSPIPEPGSGMLLLTAAGLMGVMRSRFRSWRPLG